MDGFQSSLEIELAWLTVDTDASPVVEPVGEVTGLLDLGQDNPFAYGVDCSGGHNDTLAGPDLEAVTQESISPVSRAVANCSEVVPG